MRKFDGVWTTKAKKVHGLIRRGSCRSAAEQLKRLLNTTGLTPHARRVLRRTEKLYSTRCDRREMSSKQTEFIVKTASGARRVRTSEMKLVEMALNILTPKQRAVLAKRLTDED